MEKILESIVYKMSLNKEAETIYSSHDEDFMSEMILVSANRVVDSK